MSAHLDAHLLLTFRAVVTAGKISAAAKALHLSQPAVTGQIRQLEEQCGAPLLVRSVRGVTPTPKGKELLAYAERIEKLLDEAQAAVATQPEEQGELVLGASTTVASYVLPELLAEFVRDKPKLSVRIEVGNTDRITTLVADGLIPLGLVEGLSRAPRLRIEPFLRDELVPVVATKTNGAVRHLRRASDLAHVPILWREHGSGTRAIIERALKPVLRQRAPVSGDIELGSTEGIKAAASAGLGVAFLSRWSIRSELALGRLRVVSLPDLSLRRDFSFALPGATVSGWAGRFLKFARLAAPSMQP